MKKPTAKQQPKRHRGPPVHNSDPSPLHQNAPVDAIKTDFARRLQAAMNAKGFNQAELARRCAMFLPENKTGRDSISKYVRGMVLPGPAMLDAMAKALGKKPDELLPARGGALGSRAAADNPPLDVRDLGDGMMWLRINQAVPRNTALKVMTMLLNAQDQE